MQKNDTLGVREKFDNCVQYGTLQDRKISTIDQMQL